MTLDQPTGRPEPSPPTEPASWASSPGVAKSMRANRRTGTRPEVAVRSALHRAGLRFRKDLAIEVEDGRVRPDVVFTRARLAVFIDGCFWHSCPVHATRPRANADFWAAKLERNTERDRCDTRRLEEAGWTVLRVWEHEARDPTAVVEFVMRVRQSRGSSQEWTGRRRYTA